MTLKANTKDVVVWELCKYFIKGDAVEIKEASCR